MRSTWINALWITLALALVSDVHAQANQPRLLKFKGFSRLWLPGPPTALDNGDVLSHWKMDETIGNSRVDSADSKPLVEHGGVPNAVGKITNSADFSGGGAFISPGSFYTITNASFTLCGWVYFNSHASGQTPAGTLTPGIVLESDGTELRFGVSSNSLAINTYVASTVPITNAQWIFVACIFDKAAKTIGISCNSEAIVTASHGGGVADSQDLRFGVSASAVYMDGRTDSFSWFRRAISQSDVSRLYNGGVGLDYPFP